MKESFHTDKQLAARKQDHIELAFRSRVKSGDLDDRFHYEPLFSGHPKVGDTRRDFMGFEFHFPVWVSSMTGGTKRAKKINQNLSRLCADFKLGMGLGSCRALLDSDDRIADFNMRPIIGDDRPLFANLGIAQIEEVIAKNDFDEVRSMIKKLDADGLIIHINPLQEWAQPEGDRINHSPIDSIKICCEKLKDLAIVVKEVGQGMGPKSLKALMQLPLAAIEFGASGGTNFTELEINRSPGRDQYKRRLARVGHTADQMVDFVNELMDIPNILCREFIISGGISDYLQGYYLTEKCRGNSVYGQASALLKYALEDYDALVDYFQTEMEGFSMAQAYLNIID